MGLAKDLEDAFMKSRGNPDDKGTTPELAKDISKAIQEFITSIKFRVIELETDLHVDEISTAGPLKLKTESDVKVTKLDSMVSVNPGAAVATSAGAGTVSGKGFGDGKIKGTGKGDAKGKITQKLNLKKSQGDGGSLTVVGTGKIISGDLKDKSEVVCLQKDINDADAG
tara:strand:- start:63 stop:569 length:507 start_codon:yes stop_codon:yes gene_type:complete